MNVMKWYKEDYILSDEKRILQINRIRKLFSQSYWAKDRSESLIRDSIKNSLCFGLYIKDKQIGFARFITDFATFSWFLDFIIEEEHRGKGLGKWCFECMLSHPNIKETVVGLKTRNGYSFYENFSFKKGEGMFKYPK